MPISVSLRLPDEIHEQLEDIAEDTDRSKSYLIKKAIEQYLEEYADYQIALDRLNPNLTFKPNYVCQICVTPIFDYDLCSKCQK